jgi:surfactin synthase thioesterase subunit
MIELIAYLQRNIKNHIDKIEKDITQKRLKSYDDYCFLLGKYYGAKEAFDVMNHLFKQGESEE